MEVAKTLAYYDIETITDVAVLVCSNKVRSIISPHEMSLHCYKMDPLFCSAD
jgi:hypothetical protein